MSKQAQSSQDWEREFAPKISGGRMAMTCVFYAVWLGFLAFLAVQRWTGDLQ